MDTSPRKLRSHGARSEVMDNQDLESHHSYVSTDGEAGAFVKENGDHMRQQTHSEPDISNLLQDIARLQEENRRLKMATQCSIPQNTLRETGTVPKTNLGRKVPGTEWNRLHEWRAPMAINNLPTLRKCKEGPGLFNYTETDRMPNELFERHNKDEQTGVFTSWGAQKFPDDRKEREVEAQRVRSQLDRICNEPAYHIYKPAIDASSLPYYNGNSKTLPLEYLENLEMWFKEFNIENNRRIMWVRRSLRGDVLLWFEVLGYDINTYEEFRVAFLSKYWSQERQQELQVELYTNKYQRGSRSEMSGYLLRMLKKYKGLDWSLTESAFISVLARHYPTDVARALLSLHPMSIKGAQELLEKFDTLENREIYRPGENKNNHWRRPNNGTFSRNANQNLSPLPAAVQSLNLESIEVDVHQENLSENFDPSTY